MSAYESREPGREIYFEYNTCINVGGGFSMQGETPLRQSEIYAEPMGHLVFIWRIAKGTQPGHVHIRHNIFYEAHCGAAIYSCIDPVDERTFVIDHSCYWQTTGSCLAKLNHRSYRPEEFADYQRETGQDAHSVVADPQFGDAARGDYRLNADSPVPGTGIQARFFSA